jgi:asparaginyl-tRNA synthetase
MSRIYVEEIGNCVGKEVTINGWLYSMRSSGKLHFLLVRDGTGTAQCVVSKAEASDETFELCARLTQESAVVVTGTVRQDPRSPIGYEISAKDVQLVHSAIDYPITPKEHGVDFLMNHRHLWLRSSKQHAILRVRAELIRAIREYFDSHGFLLLDAPIFTPAACEGTTNLFETDYFGEKAYLTQSGQLYMEAGAMAFGKVYCFGPTFRAEKSKTRRHLTEFWMVEPEVAYFNLDDDMDLAEDFVATIVARVVERRKTELDVLERDVSKLEQVKKPFPRISYDEALEILHPKGMTVRWGDDLGGDEETVLSEQFDRPVMIHRYPRECKAFYMKADPENPKLALCVDMIAPEGHGEIIGGGQREDNLDVLEERIREHNLPREAFSWYLDLRKYGSVPHAGFGLGIERTVGWICGVHHVRETIPFPRLMGRLTP